MKTRSIEDWKEINRMFEAVCDAAAPMMSPKILTKFNLTSRTVSGLRKLSKAIRQLSCDLENDMYKDRGEEAFGFPSKGAGGLL